MLAASPRDYASRHRMKGMRVLTNPVVRDCSFFPKSSGGSGRTPSILHDFRLEA